MQEIQAIEGEQILYNKLARYYDTIYSEKDYGKEAEGLMQLIMERKKSEGMQLLEAGCGTGNYLQHFSKKFNCTGVDISRDMLRIAKRKKLGNTALVHGNLVNFHMDRKFDAIVCLFGTISYVKTYNNLRKTIMNFSRHLKKGGILIIEPHYIKPEKHRSFDIKYEDRLPYMSTFDGINIKVARLRVPRIVGDRCIMDINIMIAEKGRRVRRIVDHQEVGMFYPERILQIMQDAGIRCEFMDRIVERGIYVGIKT